MSAWKCHLMIIWLSLKWVPRFNLGDAVWYMGRIYYVSDGTIEDCLMLRGLDNGKHGIVPKLGCKKQGL